MSAIEQDLDEYLAGPDPDYDQDPEAPQDADEANRRLRRLARIRADIAQVEETAARQIEQVNAWAERRYEVLHNRARWEQDGLEMWHRDMCVQVRPFRPADEDLADARHRTSNGGL